MNEMPPVRIVSANGKVSVFIGNIELTDGQKCEVLVDSGLWLECIVRAPAKSVQDQVDLGKRVLAQRGSEPHRSEQEADRIIRNFAEQMAKPHLEFSLRVRPGTRSFSGRIPIREEMFLRAASQS